MKVQLSGWARGLKFGLRPQLHRFFEISRAWASEASLQAYVLCTKHHELANVSGTSFYDSLVEDHHQIWWHANNISS